MTRKPTQLIGGAFLILLLNGCTDITGSRCGGGQYASANITLPDSGISGGSHVQFDFIQHDTSEFTEVVLQQIPMSGQPLELPWVRLLHDNGEVLLDQQSVAHGLGQSWLVFHIERTAALREALFEGLQQQKILVQLLRWPSAVPGTIIRIQAQAIGVGPFTSCV